MYRIIFAVYISTYQNLHTIYGSTCGNGLIWDDLGDCGVCVIQIHGRPAGSHSGMAWARKSASSRWCLRWLQVHLASFSSCPSSLPKIDQLALFGPESTIWKEKSLRAVHLLTPEAFRPPTAQIVLRLPRLFSLWTTVIQALILLRPDGTAGSLPSYDDSPAKDAQCLKGIVSVWSPRMDVHPGQSGGMLLCLDIQLPRQMTWLIGGCWFRVGHSPKEYVLGSGLKLHSMLDVESFCWKKKWQCCLRLAWF